MSHNTTSRPRMAANSDPDTGRACRWHGDGDGDGDVRSWTARALPHAVWWIIETKEYPQIRASPRPFRLGLVVKNPGAALAAPGVKTQSKITPLPPSIRRQPGDLKNHQSSRVPGGTDWSGTHNATSPSSLWKPVTSHSDMIGRSAWTENWPPPRPTCPARNRACRAGQSVRSISSVNLRPEIHQRLVGRLACFGNGSAWMMRPTRNSTFIFMKTIPFNRRHRTTVVVVRLDHSGRSSVIQ